MVFGLGSVFVLLILAGSVLAFRGTDYEHSKAVESTLKLHWKVKGDEMALALEVSQTTGWVAFGIADPESGSMPGSDIVVAQIGANGDVVLKDTYAMGKSTPLDDECNDWVLVAREVAESVTYIEMKRKLVTGDAQDRPFILNPDDRTVNNMAVVFAWGSGAFSFHKGNRIATRINFYQPQRPDVLAGFKADPKIKSFEFRSAWRIVSSETEYIDIYSGVEQEPLEACPGPRKLRPEKKDDEPCRSAPDCIGAGFQKCGGDIEKLQSTYVAAGCCTDLIFCPAGTHLIPDHVFIVESGQSSTCKGANDYCAADLAACGGNAQGLMAVFVGYGCCAQQSDIKIFCPKGTELVADQVFTGQEGQPTTCKAANDYCAADLAACGGNAEGLTTAFVGYGCCKSQSTSSDTVQHNVKANGLTFQCRIIGTNSANSTDVLLLHGFPEYKKYWDPLLDHWEKAATNIHAVACNLRGYSPDASPLNMGDYDWDDDLEKDAWSIANAVNFTQFHIVSHDLGAVLAWRMASRKELKERLLSVTTLSVFHPDALSKAILNDEKQMVASNYFNQFAVADSSKVLASVLQTNQQQLWWYNTASPKIVAQPEVPNSTILTKYPDITLPALMQKLLPISPRPAIPATSPTGKIYAPTFMICGSKDPYLLCESAIAKESKEYLRLTGYEYQYASYSCGHNLFSENDCTNKGDPDAVMADITKWILKQAPKKTRARRHLATGCDAFDQWVGAHNGDYATAIAQITAGEKVVMCEVYHTVPACQTLVQSNSLTAAWDTMCKDLKGTSASKILFDMQDNPSKVYHIVAFEHIITPGLEKHVHHMTLEGRKRDGTDFKEYLWVWALGMHPFVFPTECGVKLGGDGIVALTINIHYNNPPPARNVGEFDVSGIRVFYTENLRKHECGTIAFGDPGVSLARVSPKLPKGFSSSVFTCPSDCTKLFFPAEAQIFGSFLHQHQNGKRIWTELYRDGKLDRVTARNDFWDHNFQLTRPVNFKVKPGDSFKTTCINYSDDDSLVWGLASDEEMCINFVYYWPKVHNANYCGYGYCGSLDAVKAITDDKPVFFGIKSTCAEKPGPTMAEAASTTTKGIAAASIADASRVILTFIVGILCMGA